MTQRPPTHDETVARVKAREASVELLALVESECEGKPIAFTLRLWQLIRERAIDEAGLPHRAATDIEPMNDAQAAAFRNAVMGWGKYKGHTIADVEQGDPDYLAFLVDGTDFTKQLRRYLARRKYTDLGNDE